MSELEKLQKEFDDKKVKLQEECPHIRLSEWVDEWWALAHSTGFEVKYCLRCGEVGRRRTSCRKCGKMTEDYVDGNKQNKRPIGEYLCRKCDSEKVKR